MSSGTNYPPGYDFVLSLMWLIDKTTSFHSGIGFFPLECT